MTPLREILGDDIYIGAGPAAFFRELERSSGDVVGIIWLPACHEWSAVTEAVWRARAAGEQRSIVVYAPHGDDRPYNDFDDWDRERAVDATSPATATITRGVQNYHLHLTDDELRVTP